MKKIILWDKVNCPLLCSYRYDDIWFVENGAWDLKLNIDKLEVFVIETKEIFKYSRITFAPNVKGDYNDVITHALHNLTDDQTNDTVIDHIRKNVKPEPEFLSSYFDDEVAF